jgi:hypothetical protein
MSPINISPSSNQSIKIIYVAGDDIKYKQTPYVIQPSPSKIYPITPEPTPTPLYYEVIQNTNEPCSETLEIFQSHCMGRTKNESYCKYWELESRKKCSFIQW